MKRLLVVFDLDGTLVDSREDIALAINAVRADFHLAPLSLAEVIRAVGDGLQELVDRTFHDASAEVRRTAHLQILKRYDQNAIVKTRPYDGVEETLRDLHGRGISKVVVSNKPDPLVHKVIEGLRWQGAFNAVLGGETEIAMKPSPAGILHMRDKLGLGPETTIWMVGDGPQDMDAGRAAGARCLWAKWGFHSHQPAGVDVVLESPCDLGRMVLKGWT
jgi:phosphoglycolate phosphatase